MIGYSNRIEAIQDLLNDPRQEVEAYKLLFDLWREYKDDAAFLENLKAIIARKPILLQEFGNRIEKLSEGVLGGFEANVLREQLRIISSEISSAKRMTGTRLPHKLSIRRVASLYLFIFSVILGGISIGLGWSMGMILAFIFIVVAAIVYAIGS